MKRYHMWLAFLFSALFGSHAHGEIQTITLYWTPGFCIDSCMKQLQDQLKKMPGAASVSMNKDEGRAVIRWKPNLPFAYAPIQLAMGSTGLSLNKLKIKVRGTIQSNHSNLVLVSLGDETPFILLNGADSDSDSDSDSNNIFPTTSMKTDKPPLQMRQQLTALSAYGSIIKVEGSIYDSNNSPPYNLVIENLQVEK